MNRFLPLAIICCLLSFQAKSQNTNPNADHGKIERISEFNSQYVSARNIDVWLPANYTDKQKYAVLYMHDGQMLYDAHTTWNKQAWDADDTASELINSKKVKPFIIVGIWNGGPTRHFDYFPQKPFEALTPTEKDTVTAQLQTVGITKDNFQPESDNYLKFITEELKPHIDSTYSVRANRENTFIAGSSMGGLISFYALCEYPEVFGGAACLSTHWPGTFKLENNPVPAAFIKYLDENLPPPIIHKIYFDCGDKTLDALYPAIQKKVDALMLEKAYDSNLWMTKYFPGTNHSENAWRERLHIPLQFLMKK